MITSNLSVNRACPVYTLKTKRSSTQPSFKGNVVEKSAKQDKKEGMTTEQKTWLGVGLATIATVAIGLIAWACAKKSKPNEVSKAVETSKPNSKQQVEDLNNRFQKHFITLDSTKENELKKYMQILKNVTIVSAPFESKNEFQLYEMKTLVPQIISIAIQIYPKNNVSEFFNKSKEFFGEYLKLRGEYFDKDNEFDIIRSEVLKNPSEDVMDVEILRFNILVDNMLHSNSFDESTKSPMLAFIDYLLEANCAAKILEEFKPKKENLSENEKKYFEYMNKLGKFWHERLKKEASEELPKFTKIITGEVKAPKWYTKCNKEIKDTRYKVSFIEMCSNKTKAKWDDIMESGEKKTHLISTIYYLHSSIIELQDAVANNDYSAQSYAEEEISKLIPEVII